ncbi:YdeI/OmpD-associated family protein [Kitasatospora purpeofusca]|uniref:YdeI/OmpD-associated family protein n=1 Tax=Kitasatospora purpeofusca TaxID=67352 RepID=UPI00224D600D|nr:YdeI/OmpD-associated family protein [Kitasatospora purpeofusca]MCX4690533.1 YdeI/OmpD-associated family protein [Kitasatospora purpeofusca]
MVTGTELDELIVADGAALRAWLLDNHTASPGVWLALTRKGGSVTTLTWQQAVDEALCFGWIDGQARKRDEESSWRRLTPRRPRSVWSRRNVDNVARLEAAGLMLPSGRAAVDAAKADGRWTAAYAPSSEAEVPADLQAAIAAVPAAQAMFEVLTRTNRFALINRVNAVKRAETRTRKIAEFVAMLARHETVHPQRAKPADSPPS